MYFGRRPPNFEDAANVSNMMTNFDAYYHWLGIPPKDQPPNHYRMLGIELFEDNRDVIRQGVVKVIGLGLARIDIDIDDGPALTKTGQMMGTYDYMAPEQAVDSRNADQRADIYSLGCTMFKLLTGRAVYPEKSALRKVRAHSEAPVPSMRQVNSEIPLFLDLLCQKMLAKRPKDRFQSMDEVIATLKS